MLKIVQKLKKRIKLLTLDEDLVSVVLDMNTEYKKNDFQKKPWKAFDNIHHQLKHHQTQPRLQTQHFEY